MRIAEFMKAGAILLTTTLSIHAFNWFNPVEEDPPENLAATGIYTNLATKELADDLIPYEVNTPLWSDGAKKERFIILPEGGTVDFVPDGDLYGYPEKTVFVKNFYLDTIADDPSSRIIIETRILMKVIYEDETDDWYGFSYKWSEDGTQAVLADKFSENRVLNIYPSATSTEPMVKRWTYPGTFDCAECHNTVQFDGFHGRSILGFFTAQLNMPDPSDPSKNQLEVLTEKGVFGDVDLPDPTGLPQWASLDDETKSVETRALSYIAANCSGCHGERGIDVGAVLGPEMNFDYHQMEPKINEYIGEDGTYDYEVDGSELLYAGDPMKSLIFLRQFWRPDLYEEQKEEGTPPEINFSYISDLQMPPLAVYTADNEALCVMGQWISELEGTGQFDCNSLVSIDDSGIHHSARHFTKEGIVLQNGAFFLPKHLSSVKDVQMINHKGQIISLERTGDGGYKAKSSLTPGVYFIKAGNEIFRAPLF